MNTQSAPTGAKRRAPRKAARPPFDVAAYIKANLHLLPVPLIPEIRLYTAHSGSGLARLAAHRDDGADPPPYWAYAWAGGTGLARHVLNRPETVRGRRVLDLGAGSGLVGIAAALSGAAQVIGAEIDPIARVAHRLNCEANGVASETIGEDLTAGGPIPAVDLVAVGDLLYERELADSVVPFLRRCRAAGIEVLIGDPGRGFLPPRLELLGEYGSGSVYDDRDSATTPSAVFAFE